MKYYIIAGEASGDLHGANLVAALRRRENGSIKTEKGKRRPEDGKNPVIITITGFCRAKGGN